MFIEINNLKKSFGSDSNRVEVLRGVDFSIEKGDYLDRLVRGNLHC